MKNLFGGSLHPNFDDNLYIEYAYSMYIVKILIGNKFCSGVLLNNKNILTIKHAIEYESCEIYWNDQKQKLNDIVFHKKEDLSILRTDINIEIPNLNFYEDTGLIGKECSIGGYGIKYQANKTSKRIATDLIKRAGKNIIIWETDNYFECRMDEQGVDLEFIPTIGDSGGPVYIDNKLVGINKYVKSTDGLTDSSYGDVSGHIKVRKYLSWIDKVINY